MDIPNTATTSREHESWQGRCSELRCAQNFAIIKIITNPLHPLYEISDK